VSYRDDQNADSSQDTINQRKADQVQDRLRNGLKFLKDRNCKVKVDIRPWTSVRDEREIIIETRSAAALLLNTVKGLTTMQELLTSATACAVYQTVQQYCP
jgi:hypothetical protein